MHAWDSFEPPVPFVNHVSFLANARCNIRQNSSVGQIPRVSMRVLLLQTGNLLDLRKMEPSDSETTSSRFRCVLLNTQSHVMATVRRWATPLGRHGFRLRGTQSYSHINTTDDTFVVSAFQPSQPAEQLNEVFSSVCSDFSYCVPTARSFCGSPKLHRWTSSL